MSKPAWAELLVAALNQACPGAVTYARRLKSDRYLVWQDDDHRDLNADNVHAEEAVSGYCDLFTKTPFDPWARAVGREFDAAGILWQKTGCTYEENTGYFHHSWDWTVV